MKPEEKVRSLVNILNGVGETFVEVLNENHTNEDVVTLAIKMKLYEARSYLLNLAEYYKDMGKKNANS